MSSMDKMFKITIAAIVKDEARFLPEWIEYHRMMGVEHFFIFNNNSSDGIESVLRRYVNYGLVTLVSWTFHPGQVYAYSYAIKVFGHTTEWMALIDVDEFISMPSGELLPQFMDTLSAVDQILVPWAMFGSSGHESVPPGLVTENYVHRAIKPSHMVKSIVRPEAVTQAEVHQSRTRRGLTVNEKMEQVPEVWRQPNATFDRIRINHYYVKSREDWAAKIRRGDAANNVRTMEDFTKNDFSETVDNALSCLADELKARIRATESLPDTPFGYAPFSRLGEISTVREWFVAAHRAAQKVQTAVGEPTDWSCTFLTDRAVITTPKLGLDFSECLEAASYYLAEQVSAEVLGEWSGGESAHPECFAFSRATPGRIFVIGAVEAANADVLTVRVESERSGHLETARLNVAVGTTVFVLAVTRGAVRCGEIAVATTGCSADGPKVATLRAFAYT